MIHYRPFLNCDPPALADIWCSQPPNRGLLQPMTASLFDDLVLAQPYFDRRGLVVAVENETPIGFAHAGFGPAPDGCSLDSSVGAICLLMTRPGVPAADVGAGLVDACENYLRERGVRRLYGGGTNRLAPFYLGLYGGSGLPGVLSSDELQTSCFRRAGYEEMPAWSVFECRLAGFRPLADRQLMQLRRQHRVIPRTPPAPTCRWEASQRANWDVAQFEVSGYRGDGTACATFWDIEPLASSWRSHAMGLWDLSLPVEERGLLAVYLVGESMRSLQDRGISLVEVQTPPDDSELRDACLRLGFREADRGVQFCKHD